MSMPLKTLLFLLGVFWSFSLFGQSAIETYDATKSYSVGELVVEGEESFRAIKDASPGISPTNSDYWVNLNVEGSQMTAPAEPVPTQAPDSSPPGSKPPGTSALSGGKLMNLSTRGYVGAGEERLIGGFKVNGGTCKLLVRAFGPSRSNPDNLDNPFLTWKTNPTSLKPGTSGIVSEVPEASTNSRLDGQDSTTQDLIDLLIPLESADIQTVSNWEDDYSKGYTAFVTPESGTASGVGRIGINDISDGTGGQLINISTRGYVGNTESQYLIAGFQIRDGNLSICVRAFGPSRPNADALPDPIIELIQQVSSFHAVKKTIAMNDDYQSDYSGLSTESGELVSTPKSNVPTYLNNLLAKEAAIVITLPPGNYTARVYGVGGVSGIGRVGVDKVIE